MSLVAELAEGRLTARGVPLSRLALLLLVALLGIALAYLPLTLAAALIVGGGAFLLMAIRPVYGLYPLIFSIPWSFREIALGPLTVSATEVLVGTVLGLWLMQMISQREIRTVEPPLLVPLLLFLGAVSASSLVAQSLPLALKEIVKWVEVLGVYLFIANTVDKRQGRFLLLAMLLAGASQAVLGMYQFFARVGPEGFLLFGRFIRAHGTFEQPNPYAGYLGLILPAAYTVFLASPWSEKVDLVFWALATGAMLAMGLAMGMSLSRGAWLGFVAAFVVVNLLWGRRWTVAFAVMLVLAVLALVVLGALQLVPDFLAGRLTDFLPYLTLPDVQGVEITDANFALIERLAHWQAAMGMMRHHLWTGVGIGNYPLAYAAYALPRWQNPLGHAHNYYLNVAAEAGLPGLASYLILFAAAFWSGFRALTRVDGLDRAVVLGVIGVLTALSIHSLFDNLYVHGMYVHVGILLGLMHVFGKRNPDGNALV